MLLPVGCRGLDDWLLDALSVERLLKQAAGGQGLDLIQATVSTSTQAAAPPVRLSAGGTPTHHPRGPSSALEAALPFGAAAPAASGTPGPAGSSATGAAGAGAREEEEVDSGVPQLRLKSLAVGACPSPGQPSPALV